MDNEPDRFVETAREGDPIAIARLLVSTPSVNPSLAPGGAGEGPIARVSADLLDSWGLDAQVIEVDPGRYNVVAALPGEGPTLLLNGHLDTVGVEGMTIAPFDPVVEDGRLWGRGSCDMKGGVAALLAATARLAASDSTRPNLLVALTADEEHASLGMAALVEGGRKGGPRADLAIVCEPTRLSVMPAHKGFVWLRARFHGRAAHGSRPEIGIDAIRHAARYLTALDALTERLESREPHPLLGHGSFHAGTIRGGTAESVYPDLCELVLERRTLPGESPDDVTHEFEERLEQLRRGDPAVRADLDMTLERPGTEVGESSHLVRGLLEACSEVGVEPRVEGMTAWVDAAFLNEAGVPAVCFGPGDIEQAHTADEWIEVAQIERCALVLERFARALVER